jgi:hypothetical protein
MNLIRELAKYFPNWRDYHSNPIDAAASIGLLDDDYEPPNKLELDFENRVYLEDDNGEETTD